MSCCFPETFKNSLRIPSPHQRFPDKGSVNACSRHSANILDRSDAILTDHQAIRWNQPRKRFGCSKVDLECGRISIVDANQ